MIRDELNIYQEIKESIKRHIKSIEPEFHVNGSRSRETGIKNDFDIVFLFPGLLDKVREDFEGRIDEYGNPVKIDIFFTINKQIIENKL